MLPTATAAEVRAYARRLMTVYRRPLAQSLAYYGLATILSLVGPSLVGRIVNDTTTGVLTARGIAFIVVGLALSSLGSTVATFLARRRSYILGETVFAHLREDFMSRVLALPLATVERAGTGDLLSRTTNDLEAMNRTVRFALPEWLVALMRTVLTVAAMIITSPLVALAGAVGLPLLYWSTRRYLRYATPGYMRERISYATMFSSVTETAEGLRTIEALGLGRRQESRIDGDIHEAFLSEIYTLSMRLAWFPTLETNFAIMIATTLAWSGFLYLHHHVTLGAATAATLYAVQLVDPLDRIVSWLDELQIGQTAAARLIGLHNVVDDRVAGTDRPLTEQIELHDVRYHYRPGHDVLKGVSLTIRPGERLAIVGPSGAGKSTLGRLIAGIDRPSTGTLTIGDVSLDHLPLDIVRQHVALVTQEHHVFIGSLRDNLRLADSGASDDTLWRALEAVDAAEWARALPNEIDTVLGTTGFPLTAAQAQQLALARLVLANPHTLVLDEATALLDPRAARHLERSLHAVMNGRTVIAIAHRLHTAHDADRVCVVLDGRIAELGTHDELLALGGEYAALWKSWQHEES
jgi:ABC-type multidrug transport system fused ATPase/permease subunit